MKKLPCLLVIAIVTSGTTPIAADSNPGQDDRFFQWMMTGYVGLQVTDAYLTYRGLEDGAVEANPILGSGDAVLTAKILMVPVTAWGLSRLHRKRPKLARGLAIGLNAFYLGVAVNNSLVIEDLE